MRSFSNKSCLFKFFSKKELCPFPKGLFKSCFALAYHRHCHGACKVGSFDFSFQTHGAQLFQVCFAELYFFHSLDLGKGLGLIAWAYYLGLVSKCNCLPFHGMSCSLSWLGPFPHCLLRGHCFIGLGYNATTCLGHKRAVVKTKCFVTQIEHQNKQY